MIKGIVRRIDDLGRATLPIEYRNALNLPVGTPLDLHLENKVIHLKKGKGRKIDHLGRYVIPVEVRRTLRFEQHEFVDMYIENGEICIKRKALQCAHCGSEDEAQLMDVDGVLICRKCGIKVVDKFMEE